MVKKQGIYFLLFSSLVLSTTFAMPLVKDEKTKASVSLWSRLTSSLHRQWVALRVQLLLNKCPSFLSFEQKKELATLYGIKFVSWLCTGAENKHSTDHESASIALRLFDTFEEKQMPLPEKITIEALDQLTDQELMHVLHGTKYQTEHLETLTKNNLKRKIGQALKYIRITFFSFDNEDETANWH